MQYTIAILFGKSNILRFFFPITNIDHINIIAQLNLLLF